MVSIGTSLRLFVWAMVTLGLIMYMCAIIFVEGLAMHITDALYETDAAFEADVREHWCSVLQAMITEYKSVLGGQPWGVVLESLEIAGPFYYWAFIFYVGLIVIAVLKLLT